MTITVSRRGQMVIPANIRKKYGIKEPSQVELIDTGKEIVIVPIPKNAFKKSKGVLDGLVGINDLIKARREDRER